MPNEEEDVHVILDGRMAELLAKIAPETYQEYVSKRRGQAYIYYQVNVAIYGTLKAVLLFWKKLSSSLKMQGAHYSINSKLPTTVYILTSILLVAVGWGNLHQLAP